MKRTIPVILMMLLCAASLSAGQLQVGLLGGLRTVADSSFSDVYGSGLAITPFAAYEFSKGISLGAAWTLGYSKEKPVGVLLDPSEFRMSAIELFGKYRISAGKVDPYFKAGIAITSYSQKIPLAGVDFSKTAAGLLLGAGVGLPLAGSVSLLREIDYTVLSVTPLETKVNLGGLRFQVGASYSFTL
jgi:opacity protein-like surface antigen